MTDRDVHWLAGLMEGEGSFFPGSPSCPHLPVMSIAMADEDVMRRVGVLVERSVRVSPPRRIGWRTTYAVTVRGSGAVAWMKRLRPLMGERRRGQIDRALATYAPRSNQRLEEAMAADALRRLANGESVRSVAESFSVSVWCVYDLRLGRTHRQLHRPEPLPD